MGRTSDTRDTRSCRPGNGIGTPPRSCGGSENQRATYSTVGASLGASTARSSSAIPVSSWIRVAYRRNTCRYVASTGLFVDVACIGICDTVLVMLGDDGSESIPDGFRASLQYAMLKP